jgi:hypothetical protein
LIISTLEVRVPEALEFTVTDDTLTAELSDGRIIGTGQGIHWPDLDEDLSVEGLLAGRLSRESRTSFKRWLDARPTSSPQSPQP